MSERVALTGWGRTAPTVADLRRVRTVAEVVDAVASAPPRGVIARGLGRSYNDAAQAAGGTVLDLTGLDEVVAFDRDTGTITAGAGASLEQVLRVTLPAGWCVPVLPGTRFVTLGGALAADVHGKNHHLDGGFADHVDAFVLLTADGAAHDVRRDDPADADLFAATAGGMGLTGVIVEVTLRLRPVTTSWLRVETDRTPDLDHLLARLATDDAPHSVAWLDLANRGADGRGVLTRAWHAEPSELPPDGRADPLAYAPVMRLRVPPLAPPGALRRPVVTALNEAWYRRAPATTTTSVRTLTEVLHPLDAAAGWNRAYGPRGFLQHQSVVPLEATGSLHAIVDRLTRSAVPVTLAVLKRLGPEGPGLLSFPREGWTLAADLPNAPGVDRLLDALDEVVVAAGGRVYLAKDARVEPRHLDAMYPRLERFRRIRREVDPGGRFTSDLARRLGL